MVQKFKGFTICVLIIVAINYNVITCSNPVANLIPKISGLTVENQIIFPGINHRIKRLISTFSINFQFIF